MFLVLNGDGFIVAEYEQLDHAIESARENAAQAAHDGDMSNFYSVCLPDLSAPECDEQSEFRADEVSS